jgi:hypothetical protein
LEPEVPTVDEAVKTSKRGRKKAVKAVIPDVQIETVEPVIAKRLSLPRNKDENTNRSLSCAAFYRKKRLSNGSSSTAFKRRSSIALKAASNLIKRQEDAKENEEDDCLLSKPKNSKQRDSDYQLEMIIRQSGCKFIEKTNTNNKRKRATTVGVCNLKDLTKEKHKNENISNSSSKIISKTI